MKEQYTMAIDSSAFCDPETGLCTPASLNKAVEAVKFRDDVEIIYVGDPMCSWCWGISPALNRLQVAAHRNGINYRILLGGLRPGGGEPWNQQFKDFLRHHWEEVSQRSGQPFGNDLFERDQFDYDTEPACRAVVAARTLKPEVEARFFELVQHYFYVRNQDPKKETFYQPICRELQLDYGEFLLLFNSEVVKETTRREFQINRQWGVTGYPTVILRKGNELTAIARGYAEYEEMWSRVESLVEND